MFIGKLGNISASLTVSFDHNIVDGTPASLFMNPLIEAIKSGNLLHTDVDTKL
jgi:pyruvate/2-oxoglutarate dehydrogenase complex dihydrolipoamide acyltransferase (E2) component